MRYRTQRDINKEAVYALIVNWYKMRPDYSNERIGKMVGINRSARTVGKALKQAGIKRPLPIGFYQLVLLDARDNPGVLQQVRANQNYKRQIENFRMQADYLEGRDRWLIKHQNNRIWVAYF